MVSSRADSKIGAAISICQERAPRVAKAPATSPLGAFQQIRRMNSGVIIFSRGIESSSAFASKRALAWVSGAYLSGKRSRQIFSGGSESESVLACGHWSSLRATASEIALIQEAAFSSQRARKPRGRRIRSKSFFVLIVFAWATLAISTMAASERRRPCEMSAS